MKELFFGEANLAAGKPLGAHAQGQLFTFQALHKDFADVVLRSEQTGPRTRPKHR